jgi:ribosomal-protein-alanine N-acetyltransferase
MVDVRRFYQNLPRLETERLVLRPFTLADAPEIFEYSSDPAVTDFLFWDPHKKLQETEEYLNWVLQQYETGEDSPWGIALRETDKIIGNIHLMDMDAKHCKAEVGFVLARAYHNQGIMTEALKAVLNFALGELGLNRVEGFCAVDNLASAAVMRKAGMKCEGRLREYLFQNGAFRDYYVYSMLAGSL